MPGRILSKPSFVLLVLLWTGCGTQPVRKSPGSTVNLIDRFETATIKSGQQEIMFNDPMSFGRYLGRGWKFRSRDERRNFPWPCLGDETCMMHFEWSQRIDRRIAVKLLNLPPIIPVDFLEFTLNGVPMVRLSKPGEFGVFEYFLPASLQNKDGNTIGITLRPEKPENPPDSFRFALHSVTITHGAAIKAPGTMGNEIRPSIMLAAPIAVTFPVQAVEAQILEFDYGIIETRREDAPVDYNLRILLGNTETGREIQGFDLNLSKTETPDRWKRRRICLPAVEGGSAELTFEFKPAAASPQSADYLVLSDLLLFPQQQIITRETNRDFPDILCITISGLSADPVSAYGNQSGLTPFFDRLTGQGVLVRQAIAPSNYPTSSLLSMATGMYARDHGCYGEVPYPEKPLPTFLNHLKRAGYTCLSIIYSDPDDANRFSLFGDLSRIFFRKPGFLSASELKTEYQNILNQNKSPYSPLFIWLHINLDPEWMVNLDPVADGNDFGETEMNLNQLNLPAEDLRRVRRLAGTEPDIRYLYAKYHRLVYELDRCLDGVVHAHRDVRPGTAVILGVTSLFGYARSPHINIFSSDSLHDEVIRVPLFWGGIPRPEGELVRIDPEVQSTARLASDLCRLAGLDWIPNPPPVRVSRGENVFFSEHGRRRIVAVRSAGWKLIHSFGEPYFRLSEENLYHMENDPGERLNRASDHPAILQEMTRLAVEFCKPQSAYPTPHPGLIDEAELVLKSLNYTR